METLQDTFGEYNIRGGVFQDRIKFSFGDRKYLDVFDEEKKKKYRVRYFVNLELIFGNTVNCN